MSLSLAARLHAALPQTQCTRCGYPDCAAYADAMAAGEAAINQCPPGGAEGVVRLATLTGQAVLPLNPVHGAEGPRQMAVIDEDWCIGCTLCLKACPTDAILGVNKRMHTVIERWCTGCERCIPVCPVDCIALEPVGPETGWAAWSTAQADTAQARYTLHSKRIKQDADCEPVCSENPASGTVETPVRPSRRAAVEAALARARQARGQDAND